MKKKEEQDGDDDEVKFEELNIKSVEDMFKLYPSKLNKRPQDDF